MRLLDQTLNTPEENLALDEALLDLCEEGEEEGILRIWESPTLFVVVGYTGELRREVDVVRCEVSQIPVLRRCSGGGTVLQGPGCLNYALIIRMTSAPAYATLGGTNASIMQQLVEAIRPVLPVAPEIRGHTDLVLGNRKFSGNCQRRKQRALLFHGTMLYHFSVEVIERYLPSPPRQPEYRGGRSHLEFLTNLSVTRESLSGALTEFWGARRPLDRIPHERLASLVRAKYGSREWTYRR